MTLTCVSCKVIFSLSTLHQEHYKSDWHRYNLKRRIAELPALTKEEFDRRAEAFRVEGSSKETVKEFTRCEICNKSFGSKNAFVNHLKSKKHIEVSSAAKPEDSSKKSKHTAEPRKSKETEAAASSVDEEMPSDEEAWSDGDGDWESCDEDDDTPQGKIVVETGDCLFCDHQSDSTEANLSHMMTAHTFFLPDIEYVTDIDGFVATLAGKILLGHTCLYCNEKGKGFRSVKSVKQHMLDKGHTKLFYEGDALLEYADFYDYSAMEKVEDSVDIDELLGDSGYELVLPSGATIGHRSLALFYKQNLKPVSSDCRQKVKKVIQQYKSLGYTGTTGQLAVKRARDIAYVKRVKDKYHLMLGMKANKFMPHFRQQVMF